MFTKSLSFLPRFPRRQIEIEAEPPCPPAGRIARGRLSFR